MSITEDTPPPTFGMSTGVDEEYQARCDVSQQRLQPEYNETFMTTETDPNGMDQNAAGSKMDANKMDLSLLQLIGDALMEVCRVMDYGQTKYTRGGFSDVPEAARRYTSAMQRHWLKELYEKYDSGDPFYDTEEGLPFKGTIRHDAQVAVNALFRLQCQLDQEARDARDLDQAVDYLSRLGESDAAADAQFRTETFGELKDG